MKKMRKLGLVLVLLLLSLVAVACNGDSGDKNSDDLRVALVVTGSVADNGWNQIGYNGLLEIEKAYGAEIAYNENTPVSQYNKIIRTYAQDGYDVVLAHGTEFKDAILEVAPEYPDTQFFITSSDRTAKIAQGDNLSGILADGVQQGFLQGVTAGYIAQNQGSKIVGAVGGMEIAAITTTVEGFETGVHYVDPSIQVLKAYTGSFDDINKLKEQAITFIQQGATIIMSTANAATIGGFEATADKGGVSIGANATSLMDQFKDNLAFTANVSMVKAMSTVIGRLVDGDFENGDFIMGVKEGVVTMDMSKTQPDMQKVEGKVQDIYDGIMSGEINVTEEFNK